MKKYILVSFVLSLFFYGILSDKADGQTKSQLLCNKAKQNLAKKWTATNVKMVQKYCRTSSEPTTQQNTQPQQPQNKLQPQKTFTNITFPALIKLIQPDYIQVQRLDTGAKPTFKINRSNFKDNLELDLLNMIVRINDTVTVECDSYWRADFFFQSSEPKCEGARIIYRNPDRPYEKFDFYFNTITYQGYTGGVSSKLISNSGRFIEYVVFSNQNYDRTSSVSKVGLIIDTKKISSSIISLLDSALSGEIKLFQTNAVKISSAACKSGVFDCYLALDIQRLR